MEKKPRIPTSLIIMLGEGALTGAMAAWLFSMEVKQPEFIPPTLLLTFAFIVIAQLASNSTPSQRP